MAGENLVRVEDAKGNLFNFDHKKALEFVAVRPGSKIVSKPGREQSLAELEDEARSSSPVANGVSAGQFSVLMTQMSNLTELVGALATKVASIEPVTAMLEVSAPEDVEDMTKPQLIAYAAEKSIDLGDAKSKADILAVVQAAEQPQS